MLGPDLEPVTSSGEDQNTASGDEELLLPVCSGTLQDLLYDDRAIIIEIPSVVSLFTKEGKI
jgi:hypothetical protein